MLDKVQFALTVGGDLLLIEPNDEEDPLMRIEFYGELRERLAGKTGKDLVQFLSNTMKAALEVMP